MEILLVLALVAQETKPASSPASAASRPESIQVGDSIEWTLVAGNDGIVLRIEVATAEPLTLLAESYDSDVSLRVEDASGASLVSDDDSGRETNAFLVWRPTAAGSYQLRLVAKEPAVGQATVRILRGALD